MHTLSIATALGFISLGTGMFLLAKTNKDNLGMFFKAVSYFIIISTLIMLSCIAFHGAMTMYCGMHPDKMRPYEKFMGYGMGAGSQEMREHEHHDRFKNNCCYMQCCGNGFNGRDGKYCEEMEMCKEMKDSSCTKMMDHRKEKKK